MNRSVRSWMIVPLCAPLLFLFGCSQNAVLDEHIPVADFKWDYQDAKRFSAAVKDTSSSYNLYVNIRHSFQFEWRNVWVKIETTFPNGKVYEKRVNLALSEPDGHWYGKCLGDNCDIQIPIQENAYFPMPGSYKFRITQDMRVNPLGYIKSVGMRIEKAASPR